jgi:hypothetical protein
VATRYWRKCKEVRAEEAICQVDHVSIKWVGDKNSALPRHLRELINEEELAELQADSETVWEEMILEEPHAVMSLEYRYPAHASHVLNIQKHHHPVAPWAQVNPNSDIRY